MASNKGYRRTIYLDMDYSSVIKGTTNVSSAMRALDSDFRRSSEEIKENGKASEQLALKKEHLSQKILLQQKNVERLKEKYEKYSEELGDANKKTLDAKNRYDNARTALMKLESSLEDVNKELENQQTKLGQTITKFNDFKAAAGKMGIDIDDVANKFIGLGTALVGLPVMAAKMAGDFEKEMGKINAIADYTDSNMTFEDLKNNVLDVSSTFGIAAEEVAAGTNEIVSSTIKLSDSYAVQRNSALLAKGASTDYVTATKALIPITVAYNQSVEEQEETVNKLIVAQKNGSFSVDELGSKLGGLTSMAAQAGVGFDDVLSTLATLTANGVSTSEAVTMLKQMLSDIISPSNQAAEAAEKYGIQVGTSALKTKGLSGYLEDLSRKTGGNADKLSELYGNISSLNGMMILSSKEGLSLYKSTMEDLGNSSEAAAINIEAAETPMTRLEKAINNLKNEFIKTGGSFSWIIDLIADMINGFSNLSPTVIKVGGVVGGFLLVMGGVVKIMSMANTVMTTQAMITEFLANRKKASAIATGALTAAEVTNAGAATVATGANTGLSASFAALLPTILAVAAVIALVVGLFLLLKGSSEEAARAIDKTTQASKDSINNAYAAIDSANNLVGKAARGTNYSKEGRYLVGEEGPEIVDLPRGSKVYTAQKTRQMLSDDSGGEQTVNNYYVSLDVSKIRSFSEIETFLKTFPQSQRQTAHGV